MENNDQFGLGAWTHRFYLFGDHDIDTSRHPVTKLYPLNLGEYADYFWFQLSTPPGTGRFPAPDCTYPSFFLSPGVFADGPVYVPGRIFLNQAPLKSLIIFHKILQGCHGIKGSLTFQVFP